MSWEDAGRLALDLYHGRPGPLGPYEIGVALEPGEVLYRQVWAPYWALGTTTELVDGYGRMKAVPPAWRAWGWCHTVITSQRLATRLAAEGGRLVSNWWASIAGVQVDLGCHLVALDDRAGSWRGSYGAQRQPSSLSPPSSVSTAPPPSSTIQRSRRCGTSSPTEGCSAPASRST